LRMNHLGAFVERARGIRESGRIIAIADALNNDCADGLVG